MNAVRQFRLAASFLTRVPLHVDGSTDLPGATQWFPAVGAAVGLIGGLVAVGGAELLPAGVAAALALTVTALITGAFHHDGLADIADAFGGGWDREQRLVILKDSRHGTYGVVSLVLLILTQWSALSSLPWQWMLVGLVAAHLLGRAAILVVLLMARPARPEGLGTDYAAGIRRPWCAASVALSVAAGGVLVGWWVAVVVAAIAVTTVAVVTLSYRKIGGIAGDVLGATEQLAETAVLIVVSGVAASGQLPWWA